MSARRVAVLADIHGNLPALEAVLADVERSPVDRAVLNGDMLLGPMPGETMERLLALGDAAVWVRGNSERELVEAMDARLGASLPEHLRAIAGYGAAHVDRRHRGLLAGLPLSAVVEVDGLGPVRFCHATAGNDVDIVLVDSPVDRWQASFAGVEEPVVVLGHTHMPFDRLVDRRRFVNPGSVGMPYGTPGAHWAVLGPDVVLRTTAYDVNAAAERLARTGFPGIEGFVAENVRAVPSDSEALAAFSPRPPTPGSP
jgi:predicted phosphodiesterase